MEKDSGPSYKMNVLVLGIRALTIGILRFKLGCGRCETGKSKVAAQGFSSKVDS